MQLSIANREDFLNFLLNTNELDNWNIRKLNCSNMYLNITTDPLFYEYNKEQYIKLGNRDYNLFAHLEKTDTRDDFFKTTSHYKAVLNYIQNGTYKPREYPKEIIQRFINNTSSSDRFTMDVKLSYPHDMKNIFDYNDNFEDFYADFYCTTSTQGVIFTYTEKIKDFSIEPPKEWLSYCYDLFIKSLGLNEKA